MMIRLLHACMTGIAPHTLQLSLHWPQLLHLLLQLLLQQLQLLRIRCKWALRRSVVSMNRLVGWPLRSGCKLCRLSVPSIVLVIRVELVYVAFGGRCLPSYV